MGTGLAKPSIDIIIVNWNTGTLLRDCLKSITQARGESFHLERVVVVDNNSVDGSAGGLEEVSDQPISVIHNDTNRGFAAACNQGARGSQADYLLFLNPDTQLFADSLSRPIRFLEERENAEVGICGVQLVDVHGQVSLSCARFPTTGRFWSKMLGLDRLLPRLFPPHFMKEWNHQETREVEQIMGAFFLVRRSLFEALGGFDERFFVYFEEVDFSRRARDAGWKSFYLATARAFHQGGASSRQVKAHCLYYSLRSRLAYSSKHFAQWSGFTLLIGTLLVEPFSRTLAACFRCDWRGIGEVATAYRCLWRQLSQVLRGQR